MEREWYNRLKSSRENSKLSLKEVSNRTIDKITQQSLIKYEKGEVFPKINVLEELCNMYNVQINYILYGNNNDFNLNIENKDLYTALFFLIYSQKINFNTQNGCLEIKDEILRKQIYKLSVFAKNKAISSFNDLNSLISGIKIMCREADNNE